MRKLVFIHGWSDNSQSFEHLARHYSHDVQYTIKLADFITLDDSLCFDDLVDAMHHAWSLHGLLVQDKSIDVITHSTGALVLRAWLQRFYPNGNSPLLHLLMLAPPNFGSHLAHKGRAFFGRMVKGMGMAHPFEIGAQLLNDLELGSAYTWNLALSDCFGDYSPFSAQDIMTTICIGGSGYHGIAAIANMPGSDGVVPIASSQLSGHLLQARYDGDTPVIKIQPSKAHVAFAVFPKRNHSTILHADDDWELNILDKALHVTPQHFQAFCDTIHNTQHFQQTVMRVENQYKQMVEDYFVTFAEHHGHDVFAGRHLHAHIVQSVHTNTLSPALRAFNLDVACLNSPHIATIEEIDISITAHPNLRACAVNAGYYPCSKENHRAITLSQNQFTTLFKPNTILLIDWQITKSHSKKLYALRHPHYEDAVV